MYTKQERMGCPICIEQYTKMLRKCVKCPYCEYQACSTCTQQYLLSTPEAPHCMNCKKSWSRQYLCDSFTSKFVNNDYKRHRENVLFELEKSLMPTTQDAVRRVIDERKYNREIAGNLAMIGILNNEMYNMYVDTFEQKQINCDMRRKIFDLQMNIELLQYKINNNVQKPGERKQFIRACPADSCKGFLSTKWKCGLCEKYTCSECHDIKEDDHVCKPENVETAKLISKDTKTCPSCASLIYKIDGCDQMFCTSCHTAFSWRTGRIETGRVHNPHYFDYQRNRGNLNREIGDVQCGGMPQVSRIQRLECLWLVTLYRRIVHFEQVDLNRYRNINITNPNRNIEYRVKYMLGEMSDDEFKTKIQRVDKDLNKRLEIGQISTTFLQVMADLYTRLVDTRNIAEFETEYIEASRYFNKLFSDVSISYSCSTPFIDTDLHSVDMIKYPHAI